MPKKSPNPVRTASFALLLAALAPLAAQAAGIVCWNDKDGKRMCGDRVPPEYAVQERKVYDKTGTRVLEIRERQKTPEEIAESKRLAAEAEVARKREAYDRFLLTTFNSAAELEKTRNERLSTVDVQLELAEKSLTDNELGIAQLREQIAAAEQEGKAAPARLKRRLEEFEQTLANNRRAVSKLKSERDEIVVKFAYDIARYRELKGESMADTDEDEVEDQQSAAESESR